SWGEVPRGTATLWVKVSARVEVRLYLSRMRGAKAVHFQSGRSCASGSQRPDPRPPPVRVHDQLPHHLPGLLDRPFSVRGDAPRALEANWQGSLPPSRAILDEDLCRVLCHGSGLGHSALLSV